ncbi:DUF2892 domain-containing protein [Oxalobacteraceae bacterium R-40]|uniref:DUF2892 domain-containing protein n=1 Tax=Keguizhuia sedimenti TaxID=3064264 RepID=A0ABU1BWI9_9BURK|nr:DUF2892 domain-containing protein [Oxalobacteraceae bacterium R-40]
MAITPNVGGLDKTLRIIAGIALIAFAVLASVDNVWKIVAGLVGAVMLITAMVGFCPLNSLLGINTRRHEA